MTCFEGMAATFVQNINSDVMAYRQDDLASEMAELRAANRELQRELIEEQARRRGAEEERSRLQRTRDELVKTVLALEKRAAEAEDEAARIQREAAATDAAAAAGSGGGKSSAAADAKRLRRDVEVLLAELDRERQVNAELSKMVERGSGEAKAAAQRAAAAERQVQQLQHAGGGTSKAAASPALPEEGAAAGAEQQRGLRERISGLKGARDRLIAALDAQSAEAYRLSVENAALAEALGQAQEAAAIWEAQAQAGLAHSEQLKDLLEESAAWAPPTPPPPTQREQPLGGDESDTAVDGGGRAAAAAAGAAEPDRETGRVAGEVQRARQRLERSEGEALLLRARCAELEVQVRALCAELTRAAAAASATQRAVLPVLGGVEGRLAAVLRLKPRAHANP